MMNLNDFPDSSGIYCYINIVNDKRYIGQSKNIKNRIKEHESNFINNAEKRENKLLLRAINKYGRENFNIEIICLCEVDNLNDNELFYIKEYSSHSTQNGYNISWGGNTSNRGISPSDITKKKMSISMKKLFSNKENHPFFGKHHSEETKNKISIFRRGKAMSEEVKKKISASLSGENNPSFGKSPSTETRRKIGDGNRGKLISEETKEKMRESHVGLIDGEKNPMFGRKRSENTTSKYLGVSKSVSRNYVCWRVYIGSEGKSIRIGSFKSEILAAEAYDKYIIEHNLNRPLNFPIDK